MLKFLISHDTTGVSPDLTWRNPPTTRWSDQSDRIRAWVWGRPVNDGERGLRFRSTITHDITDKDTFGPHIDVSLDSRGRGSVAPDALGLHPLYRGSHQGATFASNCPHRVAEALVAHGATVRKSLSFSALIASCERPIGLETGFENVRCTPFGERLTVDPGQGIRCVLAESNPWTSDSSVPGATEVDSVIDDCMNEMIERLREWIGQATDPPALLLTGGLDSRMVLALVIAAGRLKDVVAVTNGIPQNPDVVVAAELARKLGIPHVVRPPQARVGLKDHVRRSAGMLSCRMRSKPDLDDSIVLHGLLGETLRSNIRTHAPIRTREQLTARWIEPHAHAALLHREAQVSALTQGLEAVLEPLDAGLRPEMGLDVFYIQHLVRRWISARPDFFQNKVFPLYCPRAVALALRLGWKARQDAVIHQTVIARVGGALLDVPYVGDKEPRAIPTLSSLGIEVSDFEPRAVATSYFDNTLVNRGPRVRVDDVPDVNERLLKQFREFVSASPLNPIWDVLDQAKVREALEKFAMLDVRSRQEVDAAMAGVLWHS